MAGAIGFEDEARQYEADVAAAYAMFRKTFYDADKGLYLDGTDTDHISSHANLFALAFGLVPEADRKAMAAWLAERGMRCSVYTAQYLLEGLFENGADVQALELITASGDRSWRHMVESGATITWEAWDLKYKPNQDWNHAWGAAPANLLPRFVLGAEPASPGWETARISPRVGRLEYAKGIVPTLRGPIAIDWQNSDAFSLSLALPEGMRAKIDIPAPAGSNGVWLNGQPVEAAKINDRWILESAVSGTVNLKTK
jgi:hypothetical protein